MKHILVICLLLISPMSSAALITISDSFDITRSGQSFFDSEVVTQDPALSSLGTLKITLNGDYDGNQSNEFIDISFGGISGFFRITFDGVITNTVTGLNLVSFSSVETTDDFDALVSADFSVSNSALFDMLDGDTFAIAFSNGSRVNPYFFVGTAGVDEDFVSYEFTFDSRESFAVSAPGSLFLFVTGLMLVISRGTSRLKGRFV